MCPTAAYKRKLFGVHPVGFGKGLDFTITGHGAPKGLRNKKDYETVYNGRLLYTSDAADE